MTLKLENIAKVAQKYVADCPVLVLGTGSTIPHGLPSMAELSTELVTCIKVPSGSRDVASWTSFKTHLKETSDLERTLDEVALTETLLDRVTRETWEYVCERDLSLHDSLLTDSKSLPLSRLLRHLLRTARARACVITTNYDRVAEYAASAAGAAFFTGFATGFFSRFAMTNLPGRDEVYFPGHQGHVDIWKVHGSLDWFENDRNMVVSIQGAHQVLEGYQPLIVTPGTTKYRKVHHDPFRTILTKADAALESASGFLCIGYGFNDEHVQPKLLERHRNAGIPLTLVTKRLTHSARKLLLNDPADKFLIFEESPKGSRIYMPTCPSGDELEGHSVWKLPDFLDLVMGRGDR